MTSPAAAPSVTVMIRPAVLLMRPPPEMGVRWAKQARHVSQMDRLCMRGDELGVAAPARPSGRDGIILDSLSTHYRRGGGGLLEVVV